MEVVNFDDSVRLFILSLPRDAQSKAYRRLDLLSEFGHELRLPYSKSVGRNLFELRVRGVVDVRIFYIFHHDRAILLHGFIKKSDKIPPQELAIAYIRKRSLDMV
mgnify:CR=1 FL=1